MPTYEYHCNACHGDFEVEKRMSDPVEQTCALCGSPDTQRLISHSSFVLKGSGWYVTDYARKNGSGNGSGGTHGRRHSSSTDGGSGNGGNGDTSSTAGGTPTVKTPDPAPASKTGSSASPTGGAG
ncbi:MAG TPA: zinc ribbon domain-containing protein [Myxococcota bacterium]|nr:zinc ribbon domain-containing protein [Myxococcota bacterium]HQK52067.1 zinc ribbon domain-containing protein [Myxococcota bacterium]